jgi:hypothetical protein
MSALVDGEPAVPDSTRSASEASGSAEDRAAPGPDSTRSATEISGPAEDSSGHLPLFTRVRAWVRLWFPATALVLALLGIVVIIYGFWILPDTAIPQPERSYVAVRYSLDHSATAPITMTVTLTYGDPYANKGAIEMDISLQGTAFLRHATLSMLITVPTGVQLFYSKGRVIRHYQGDATQDAVYVKGTNDAAEANLIWHDDHSAPLQVHGANLAAWFPDVDLMDLSTFPEPRKVNVIWNLDLNGMDFTYLAGRPPDKFDPSGYWTWKSRAINSIQGGGGPLAPGFYLEARSITAEESANAAEFKSGIAFGVAAAALIAAIQEFVSSATDSERHPRRRSSGHPAAH